jgi:hypothetical protein
MALLRLAHSIANDPNSIKAIYRAFQDVEQLNESYHTGPYRYFRVKGQGAPENDRVIEAEFVSDINGVTRIKSWQEAKIQ